MLAYCGNNPVARADNGGNFWNIVIGAAVGGIVSGVISVATQVIKNNGFNNINWGQVGVATAAGAVSGGLAATGIPVGGQVIANGIIGAVSSGVDTYLEKGDSATALDYIGSMATGVVIGVIGGRLGGSGTGTRHLSRSAGRFFGKVGTAMGEIFENGVRSTFNTVAKAGKYYYSQITTQAIQCGRQAILPIIASNIPSALHNIGGALVN